jgi:PAS domain S-box-containing protein
MPVLISYVDAQGHYRLNNLTYEKWFGRSREELYGKHLREVVGEAAFEAVRPDVERALSGVPVTYERQMPYVSAGSRWVQGTCIPDIDGAGAVRGLVVLVQDIGERKQHEEQLRERSEFERHVLGIVSHDLRNPISVMMMSAATLLMRGEANTNIASGLRRIVASGERATRMIRDLLDFTQARVMGGIPLERRPFDFHVHVRQGTEELRAAHPDREILITASGDGQGAWDPDRVTQLLVNLVGNAVAYSPETTPVQVRTCGEERSLLVEVHNRGAPIPAETMQGLFEPFKRGKEHRESTSRSVGLGLYIVKQLVLGHGGTIHVTSTEAEGTTFSVRLPRDADGLASRSSSAQD